MSNKPANKRSQINPKLVNDALSLVRTKMHKRLDQMGWGTFSSTYEILGTINGEVAEFADAIRSGTPTEIENELSNIAMACIFGIACIEAGTVDGEAGTKTKV